MIEKGQEEKKIKKTIVPDLFHWRYIDEVPDHEYQLAIHRITNSIQTIESNLSTTLFETLFSNNDPGFDIEDFLDYQYEYANENPKRFLDTLGSLIQFGLSIWNKSGIVPNNFTGKRVDNWVAEKRLDLKKGIKPLEFSDNASHKVLLLHELGIINHLQTKYFSPTQTERNSSDLARLIATIINESNPETIRKAISGLVSKGKDNILTKKGIREVKKYLYEYGIDLNTLKDPD